ncbi:cell division protein FtsX [Kerstersia gyiorum]|uniref:Cell division protein FtsX n=1 Tax=Kerstersia gyiorum TaxID=206506 RepID=A0A171KWD7_9BURK|nr:ABC transporter permease [Kerstersia gyiorum]KKO73204.1 permease [Kerstersia gyiorum]
MKSLLRQHRYALGIALQRLARQPFSSLANLCIMALALCLPLLGAAILDAARPVTRDLSVTPEVTVFMQVGTPRDASTKTLERVRSENGAEIQSARLVPKENALAALQRTPGWRDALAVLPDNPLPDAITVTFAAGPQATETATQLAQQWQSWPGVDRVQLDSDWMQRLEALASTARIALLLLAIAVGLVVLATVFNTVRMQALTQREEIAVARLVGATESFVRRPFLYQGALSGLLASLLAIVFAVFALRPMNGALTRLAQSYNTTITLQLPAVADLLPAIVITAALCALAARWSVTRSTRF